MRIDLSEREGTVVVTLTGDATIDHAGALRDALADVVRRAERVEVDVAAVTGVHYPVLQTLCSAHRTCTEKDKLMSVNDQRSPSFADATATAGLDRHKGCPLDRFSNCLWLRSSR